METLLTVILLVLPYLLGSISGAVIFSRLLHGVDIRTLGSNNAGSTNTFRQLGFKAGILTQVTDILKGALSAALPYFALWWFPETSHALSGFEFELQSMVCGMLAVIGHLYPIFFGFKGGKGINTLLGMMLVTNWVAALICLAGWILILYLTRYVAIASMGSLLCYPVYLMLKTFWSHEPTNWLLVGVGFGLFLLVVFTHRSNISNLRNGTEGKNHWFEGRIS